MAIPSTSETSVSEALKQAEPVVGALGNVFARWCAVYTMELLTMLEKRGSDVGSRVGRETGQAGAEEELAAAPEWIRKAYERAKAEAKPAYSGEREVRGRLIRNRLALAIKKQHMTQSDLARRIGRHASHVSRVFRNPERCQLSTLTAIAEALGVDLSDILRGFPDRE